jgi:hypothetical protein
MFLEEEAVWEDLRREGSEAIGWGCGISWQERPSAGKRSEPSVDKTPWGS